MAPKETQPTNIPTSTSFASADHQELRPQPAGRASPGQTEKASKWAVMAIIAIGVFMATLDTSIVNISLPAIARAFVVPLSGAIEWVIIAPFSGSLADRTGTRWLAAGGLTMVCIGLLLISQLDAHSSLWDIIWRLIITGMGQAIFQSPNNSALMGAAPEGQQGSASGFLATGRVVGQSLSVALAGAVFASLGGAAAGRVLATSTNLSAAETAALQQTFSYAFHITFIVCACIAAIGIFTSLVRGKERV